MAVLTESFTAGVTGKGLFPCVSPYVSCQITLFQKTFSTHVAVVQALSGGAFPQICHQWLFRSTVVLARL